MLQQDPQGWVSLRSVTGEGLVGADGVDGQLGDVVKAFGGVLGAPALEGVDDVDMTLDKACRQRER